MAIVVQPFVENQADEIASWPLSAEEAKAWAGRGTSFPLAPAELIGWHDDPDIDAFVALGDGNDDRELLAYGELWVDEAEQEIELARIIVRPTRRGVGVGRSFVEALAGHAASFRFPDVFIRVTPDNTYAIRCYHSSGFVRVAEEEEKGFNQRQPLDYVWLRLQVDSSGSGGGVSPPS